MRLTWASQVACECFFFSPLVTNTDTWIQTLTALEHYSGYSIASFKGQIESAAIQAACFEQYLTPIGQAASRSRAIGDDIMLNENCVEIIHSMFENKRTLIWVSMRRIDNAISKTGIWD